MWFCKEYPVEEGISQNEMSNLQNLQGELDKSGMRLKERKKTQCLYRSISLVDRELSYSFMQICCEVVEEVAGCMERTSSSTIIAIVSFACADASFLSLRDFNFSAMKNA